MSLKENGIQLLPSVVKVAAAIVVIAGVMVSRSIISPLLLAVFISVICAQPIFWLVKFKVPSWLALVLVLGGLSLVLFVIVSVIGKSMTQFSSNMPQYIASLNETTSSLSERFGLDRLGISSDVFLDEVDRSKILGFTSKIISQLGNLMSNFFLILLVTIFILAEMKMSTMKADVLERDYGQSLRFLDDLGGSIRHYLSLKTIISLITGVIITISLKIIGVDYPILWGVIAFLLNYIPTIGSIIAAIPTMLLALVQLGLGEFLWTGIVYLAVNILMGSIIEPRFMGKGLGLSTLVVFLSLIVWGYVLGAVGMFLSVPITLSIKIILEQNEKTRWVALLLASAPDVRKIFNKKQDESV